MKKTLAGAVLCAALFPACAGAAFAQTSMSLADAVNYALAHDPTVAADRSSFAQAQEAYAKQRMISLPTVNGQLQNFLQKSSNFGGSFAVIGAQQQNVTSQNTAQIGTSYNLTTGGLAFIQMDEAKAQLESATQTLKRAQAQVASNVTQAFYAIAQKDGVVGLDQSNYAYQTVLVRNAQAKERAGVAAGVDVLRAEVAQKQSQSALVAAQADAQNARDALSQLIGAPFGTAFAIPAEIAQPPLPAPSVDKLVAIAQDTRPDVRAARQSLHVAQLVRRGFNVELYPQIGLSAAFGNQFSPTTAVLQQQAIDQQFFQNNAALVGQGLPPLPLSDKPVLPRGVPGFWQLQASSTFTLPLGDYGARHFEKMQDDAAVSSAQAAYDNTASRVALEVRQNYRAAQTAQAQLAYAVDESQLGRESARVAQLQYQNGVISLTDVLNAQQTAVQAQTDLINARVSYVEAIVNLRVALGTYDAASAVADLR